MKNFRRGKSFYISYPVLLIAHYPGGDKGWVGGAQPSFGSCGRPFAFEYIGVVSEYFGLLLKNLVMGFRMTIYKAYVCNRFL